jgi:hypothetical protein
MLPAMQTGNLCVRLPKGSTGKGFILGTQKTDATAKQRIWDEFCVNGSDHRQHAIRLLNGPLTPGVQRTERRLIRRRKQGRPPGSPRRPACSRFAVRTRWNSWRFKKTPCATLWK